MRVDPGSPLLLGFEFGGEAQGIGHSDGRQARIRYQREVQRQFLRQSINFQDWAVQYGDRDILCFEPEESGHEKENDEQ